MVVVVVVVEVEVVVVVVVVSVVVVVVVVSQCIESLCLIMGVTRRNHTPPAKTCLFRYNVYIYIYIYTLYTLCIYRIN